MSQYDNDAFYWVEMQSRSEVVKNWIPLKHQDGVFFNGYIKVREGDPDVSKIGNRIYTPDEIDALCKRTEPMPPYKFEYEQGETSWNPQMSEPSETSPIKLGDTFPGIVPFTIKTAGDPISPYPRIIPTAGDMPTILPTINCSKCAMKFDRNAGYGYCCPHGDCPIFPKATC